MGVPPDAAVLRRHVELQGGGPEAYHALGDDGLPRVGACVSNGDAIAGITVHDPDSLIPLDRSRILLGPGGRGSSFVVEAVEAKQDHLRVSLVTIDPLRTGDKGATRGGKKGVFGEAAMPFLASSGMEPTVVMHIQSLPSRCSVQVYMEQVLAQLCVDGGYRVEVAPLERRHRLVPVEAGISPNPRDVVEVSFADVWGAGFVGEEFRCGVTGEVLTTNGFLGPVEFRRVKQGAFPTAREVLKVCDAATASLDPMTLQPRRTSGGKTGCDEIARCLCSGATAMLREWRSEDERVGPDGRVAGQAWRVLQGVGTSLGMAIAEPVTAPSSSGVQEEEQEEQQQQEEEEEEQVAPGGGLSADAAEVLRYILGE